MMTAALPASATIVTLASSRDNTVDDQPRIQAALDAVEKDGAGGGGEVYLTRGNYYIGPVDGSLTNGGLKIGDNVHLHLHRDAVIIRRLHSGGDVHATIRNKDFTVDPPYAGNCNIRVSGGTIRTAEPVGELTYRGTHLSFVNVQYLSIDDVRITGVKQNWNTSFVDCQDVTISNVTIDSGTALEEDGLHFAGGSRIAVTNCNIRCGDDAIALVHVPPAGDMVVQQSDLTDFVASNCTLYSHTANAFKALIEDNATKAIRGVRVSNIVAKAGDGVSTSSRGIDIRDLNNEGTRLLSDIALDGVTLDCSQNSVAGGNPLLVRRVDRLQVTGLRADRPALAATIDDANDVELRDCAILSPRESGQSCVRVAIAVACTNVRVLGGEFIGGSGYGVQFGSASFHVTGFELSNALVSGSGLYGVLIYNGSGGIVSNNRVNSAGVNGIEEVSPSNNNLIIGNRVVGSGGAALILSGDRTEAIRNVPTFQAPIPDSGGFRQTVDGWTYTVVALEQSIELNRFGVMPGNGARFRAVRPGSITGMVVLSDQDCSAGSITLRVWKNTGVADAAGSSTSVVTGLVSTGPVNKWAITVPKDLVQFDPGDELYVVMTQAGFGPVGARICVSIEIED